MSISSSKFNDYYKFWACVAANLATEDQADDGQVLLEEIEGQLNTLLRSGHKPKRTNIGGEVRNVDEVTNRIEEAKLALLPLSWAEVGKGETVASKVEDILEGVKSKKIKPQEVFFCFDLDGTLIHESGPKGPLPHMPELLKELNTLSIPWFVITNRANSDIKCDTMANRFQTAGTWMWTASDVLNVLNATAVAKPSWIAFDSNNDPKDKSETHKMWVSLTENTDIKDLLPGALQYLCTKVPDATLLSPAALKVLKIPPRITLGPNNPFQTFFGNILILRHDPEAGYNQYKGDGMAYILDNIKPPPKYAVFVDNSATEMERMKWAATQRDLYQYVKNMNLRLIWCPGVNDVLKPNMKDVRKLEKHIPAARRIPKLRSYE